MYEVHPLRMQVRRIDAKFAENGPDLVRQGQTTLAVVWLRWLLVVRLDIW